ncbi:MAG: mannose-6-phosphate isomerase, class I [Acidobacteriota bacterium]
MSEVRLARLQPAVQHYEWGGTEALPALLGVDNPDKRPFAELWFGAHPKAPSMAETPRGRVPLDAMIAQDPQAWLGEAVIRRFGPSLPFLLKVLDARKMLSIQVHPAREQARQGFERENAMGIPVHAPHRNYRDRNHKPEVHAAQSEFWMLHGFRPLEEIAAWLDVTPEACAVMPDFHRRLREAGAGRQPRAALLRELYTHFMHLPQERADELLDALLARIERAAPWPPDAPEHWALRAAREFPLPGGRRDRGIFSIFLLNLVQLEPGQGTFQPAGVLHAYLQGTTVELMANSDNVLRGGLTPKHVDVAELLRVVRFDDSPCQVLMGEPEADGERVYRTAAEDFELSCFELAGQAAAREARGPEILLATEGAASVSADGAGMGLTRGQAVFLGAGVRYELSAKGRAVVWRAKAGLAG